MRNPLAARDPNEVVSVEEACEFLGISRPTIYRIDTLTRARLSPGRVGYRVGDLTEHLRLGAGGAAAATDGVTNIWVDDFGGASLPAWMLELPARINTIVRRKPRTAGGTLAASAGGALAFLVELPAAKDWWGTGHRDLVLIDYDGLNAFEPMIILAQEDELIRQEKRLIVTEPFSAVRLLPMFGWQEKMPDGWWVA